MRSGTWAAIVGICTILSGTLSQVASALPSHYAQYLTYVGFGLVAIDRIATGFENHAFISATTKKTGG